LTASRLGPEPWLSLVSVGVGLAAAVSGGVILQLAPNIAAPEWLICVLMTMWLGFECGIVLLVRAIDLEAGSKRLARPDSRAEISSTFGRGS